LVAAGVLGVRIREYELIIILRPTLTEEQIQERVDRLTRTITSRGGEVMSVEPWGRRRLAYPIQKSREGIYILMRLKLASSLLEELKGQMRLDEEIIRHLLIRVGD
jgi:small subunit ribosomal protein S6